MDSEFPIAIEEREDEASFNARMTRNIAIVKLMTVAMRMMTTVRKVTTIIMILSIYLTTATSMKITINTLIV